MRKYRVYSQEFKEAVSRRLVKGESVSAVHDELQIGLSVLYRWRDAYRKEGAAGLRPTGGVPLPPRPWEQRIAELERKIGQQALDMGSSSARGRSDPPLLSKMDPVVLSLAVDRLLA